MSYMSTSKYVNIVIDKSNYEDLKILGEVPESFNDVIGRLLKEKQPIIEAIRAAKKIQE
jgi:predicted CopG family antitoxin